MSARSMRDLARIVQFAEDAYAAGAQVVCFPELAIPGYPRRTVLQARLRRG